MRNCCPYELYPDDPDTVLSKPLAMTCHICSRAPNSRRPFYCPTCARNQLYQLRVENVRVLLEKGSIGQQIEDAISHGSSHEQTVEPGHQPLRLQDDASRRWALQVATSRQAEATTRTKALNERIKSLKFEIKDKQTEVSQRKAILSRQRSDAESANYQLAEREAATLAGVQNSTKRTDHLWHSLHSKTAEARIFLCREAANLYGLQQMTIEKDGRPKEIYVIGGVPLLDLREMNGALPAHISTSLANVAHLLVLVSHYLSLRLPAEITLPHKNYPATTIYAPGASYIPPESRSKTVDRSETDKTDSRSDLPRPRPLFITKNLPVLSKEDPGTYGRFLEGTTLLAWNVSWLCRTQGLNLASDSWEEVCDIGKNLWQLLVAPPTQASTLTRAFAGRDIQTKIKAAKDAPKTTIHRTKSFPMLGHYSHGTAHSFLGASEGTEFMRKWKLPHPAKVNDKLKSTLLGEMASAEWELLDRQEWDEAAQEQPQPSQEPAATPGPEPKSELGSEKDDTSSQVLGSTESAGHVGIGEGAKNQHLDPGRHRGSSGWMKLRSR